MTIITLPKPNNSRHTAISSIGAVCVAFVNAFVVSVSADYVQP